METRIKFCFTQVSPRGDDFDTPGGGPAVMPSGHARHNRINSGEEFLQCQPITFPTALSWPHLSTVLTAPV